MKSWRNLLFGWLLLCMASAWAQDFVAVPPLQARVTDLAGMLTPDQRQRLENVLKVSPMYQGSLRELSRGIQGVPVARFRDEPPPADFGPPLPVELRAEHEHWCPYPAGPGEVAIQQIAVEHPGTFRAQP